MQQTAQRDLYLATAGHFGDFFVLGVFLDRDSAYHRLYEADQAAEQAGSNPACRIDTGWFHVERVPLGGGPCVPDVLV